MVSARKKFDVGDRVVLTDRGRRAFVKLKMDVWSRGVVSGFTAKDGEVIVRDGRDMEPAETLRVELWRVL